MKYKCWEFLVDRGLRKLIYGCMQSQYLYCLYALSSVLTKPPNTPDAGTCYLSDIYV